jgi:hypothetical protein
MGKIREKGTGRKKYGGEIQEKSTGKIVRPDRASSGHVTLSLPVIKGPTRADIAQLMVAHAQNILPDKTRD